MSKNLTNTGRSSSKNKNGGPTMVDRTQNIAALSNVSPAEAAFLSSLPAEEFNALLEECSDIARGM